MDEDLENTVKIHRQKYRGHCRANRDARWMTEVGSRHGRNFRGDPLESLLTLGHAGSPDGTFGKFFTE